MTLAQALEALSVANEYFADAFPSEIPDRDHLPGGPHFSMAVECAIGDFLFAHLEQIRWDSKPRPQQQPKRGEGSPFIFEILQVVPTYRSRIADFAVNPL